MDTVSRGTALAWTLLFPVWKAFTSTRNQICASDTSRNPLQSYLVFHSILDLLLKISFWANFYSSDYIILSYLVKKSIQKNVNRKGEKRVGAGREKSPSFTKKTREMISNIDEQIIVIFIWKMNGIVYIYLENQAFSTVNLPHITITQTSCNFSPLLMLEFGSIRRCLASLHQWILNGM